MRRRKDLGPNWQPAEEVFAAREVGKFLTYDPETGDLRWKDYPGRKKAMPGALAGLISPDGYRRIGIRYRWFAGHRLAWAVYHGEWPTGFIDHINGDRADNRISNLRLAEFHENARNRLRRRDTFSSKYKGVHFHKGAQKWCAACGTHGTDSYEYIGLFDDEREAALAYNRAAEKKYGAFACLNEVAA